MAHKPMSNFEQEIMDMVWANNPCSVRDVLAKIPSNKVFAYTTIATILNRLYDKGLLVRKNSKTGYIYSPKLSKESYSKTLVQSFFDNFIPSFGDTAIASFASSIEKLPEDKRQRFLKLINEQKNVK